jgi:hypothetical protein
MSLSSLEEPSIQLFPLLQQYYLALPETIRLADMPTWIKFLHIQTVLANEALPLLQVLNVLEKAEPDWTRQWYKYDIAFADERAPTFSLIDSLVKSLTLALRSSTTFNESFSFAVMTASVWACRLFWTRHCLESSDDSLRDQAIEDVSLRFGVSS